MSFLVSRSVFRANTTSQQVFAVIKRSKYAIPRRKKIWEPTAKTKLFRIPQHKKVPQDDEDQFWRLMDYHNLFIQSLVKYCEKEFYLPTITSGGLTAEQVSHELVEHKRLLEENELENARVAAAREERIALEEEMTKEYLLRRQIEEQERIAAAMVKAAEVVELETKRSSTFITKETLVKAIEEALLHPVDYDYAIDVDGNVYYDEKLHPYAFKPNAVPETSSVTEEYEKMEKGKAYKFEATVLK